jgi:hypothetical protein
MRRTSQSGSRRLTLSKQNGYPRASSDSGSDIVTGAYSDHSDRRFSVTMKKFG